MKPNFALDLTHDGIGLLHRGKGGWLLAGEVRLDDPDLTARLGMMRQTAVDLESGGFTSQLILPASQILFTTMTAPGPDNITREARIREGLEGLTPYPVDELVFDWHADGDMAHVAVIARETLGEAEGFALDNRLNPVCFCARAHGSFGREVYFGATSCADQFLRNGAKVDPDRHPIPALMGTGVATIARTEPDVEPGIPDANVIETPPQAQTQVQKSAPEADTANPPQKTASSKSSTGQARSDIPELAPFPPAFEPEEDSATLGARPAPQPTPPKAPNLMPPARQNGDAGKASEAPVVKPKLDSRQKPPPPAKGPSTPKPNAADAPPAFSTRRSVDAQSDASTDTPRPSQSIAPRILVAPPSSGSDVGRPTQPQKQTHVPVTAPNVVGKSERSDTPPPTKRAKAGARKLQDAARNGLGKGLSKGISGGLAGATTAANAASALASRTAKALPKRQKSAAPERPIEDTSVAGPVPGDMPQSQSKSRGQKHNTAPTSAGIKEAEALTIFGARAQQNIGGKPKFLGLFLVLGLLLFLAIVAVWSMFFLSEQSTGLFPGRDDQFESAITTGPETGTGDGFASLPEFDPEGEDQFSEFDLDAPLDGSAETDPTLVEGDPQIRPEPLSAEAAETRYAATGIWERAPDPLTDHVVGRLDGLYVASIDPVTAGHDAVALPSDRLAALENAPAELLAPPPSGTRFDLDERGLVRATPQGSLTPEGVLVIAGRPSLVPAQRPGDDTQDTAPLVENTTPSIRPKSRPDGLIESNERELFGGRSRVEMAGLRPKPRPQSIAALTEQAAAISNAVANAAIDDAAAAAIAAVNAPTKLAVARSPEPKSRPQGFEKLMEAARAADASDGSVVVAAAPRNQTVSPAIPTRASVAKQATVKNAISLRKVSLIGIYGSASKRRALVRLPSGRYVKVGIGDRLDGGKVVSISASKLVYKKGSKSNTLNILPFS